RNRRGAVESIRIEKGTFFKKDLEIPADRVLRVEEQHAQGQVTVDVREEELQALSAHRPEKLASGQQVEREALQKQEQKQEQAEQQSTSLWVWLRQLGPGLLGGLSG